MGLALCPGGFFATCATRSDSKTTLQPNKLCSHAKRSQWQISKLKPNMAEEAQVTSFEIMMDTKIKPSAVGEHAGYENLAGLLENVLLDFLESDDSTYLTNVDPELTHGARYWVDCNSKTGTVLVKLNLIFSYTGESKPEVSKPKLKTAIMNFASASFPNMTVGKKCLVC